MNREDWNYLSINECADVIGGGTPSTKNPNYWYGNIPWISPKDLSNNKDKYISNGERFITQVGLEKSSAKLLPVNSLLFSSRAPIGYLAINTKPVATNQGFKSLILKEEFDVEFFYYLFKDKTEYIKNFASGSTFQEVSGSVVKNLSFLIPPKQEQKRISNILSKLDKKIELNLKMNETLEDIAKTLFKSWFIDFDPVRAKAEGRPTGLSKEISDLFPDSFEDSELGEIPSGWQIKEIQELCESISSGGTPKRKQKDYWENGTIDWFKTGELRDTYLLESEEKITDSAVKESSCKLWNKGTILFAIYASPTVGRLGILTKPSTSNQAAAGLMPKESVGMPFLKNLLLFSRKEMQHIASGAAHQKINVGILKEFKVISPNHEIAGHFSKINEPIEKKIFSNLREISYLSQIRDLLLPKLISGELKISDAENMVEGADI